MGLLGNSQFGYFSTFAFYLAERVKFGQKKDNAEQCAMQLLSVFSLTIKLGGNFETTCMNAVSSMYSYGFDDFDILYCWRHLYE